MVGLSIVLESSLRNNNNNGKYDTKNVPKVINKANMIKPAPPPCRSSPVVGFLDRCCLCGRKLLAGKDIYMYKGDKAFCSMECRSNQILMDEEENNYNTKSGFKRDNCSVTANIKGANSSSQSSSSSSSSRRNHKGPSTKNGANGFVF